MHIKVEAFVKVLINGTALAGAILGAGIMCGCSSPSQPSYRAVLREPVQALSGPTNALFADYDSTVVRTIKKRWRELIDEARHMLTPNTKGKVILEFRLESDGRVRDMRVVEDEVDPIRTMLCQKSVLDSSPFTKWPDGAVDELGANYRDIRFSFFYD